MSRAWTAWVRLWDTREHPRVLALIRSAVALVVLADLLTMARLGLVEVLWAPMEAGGIPNALQRPVVPPWYQVWDPTPTAAWTLWGGQVAALLLLAVGWRPRWAALAFVLLSAQAALVTPLADRGIDLLLRNVCLILVFADSGATWSVSTLRAPPEARIPGWPRRLILLQLLAMYAAAGVQKTGLPWTPLGGFSALYIVLKDPSIGVSAMPWLEGLYPLTQVATATTVLFELGAIGILGVYWLRWTHARPGRLRAWVVRRRPHLAWLAVGVALHLGIAVSMALGIFPWAVLALYPAFVHPDELLAAGEWLQRRRALRPG